MRVSFDFGHFTTAIASYIYNLKTLGGLVNHIHLTCMYGSIADCRHVRIYVCMCIYACVHVFEYLATGYLCVCVLNIYLLQYVYMRT